MNPPRKPSRTLNCWGTDRDWNNWLVCPSCHTGLQFSAETLLCPSCKASWPVRDGVPQFVTSFPYWGEIPREDMKRVNAIAKSDSWRSALAHSGKPSVERAAEMILNLDRANWSSLVDCPADGRVLDLGAGMGTTSHALAMSFGEVVAVEPVAERIEFMQCRFRQEKLTNIRVIRGSVWQLPFPDESFDLVVMNGVLEWVAEGQPGDPEAVQQTALRNVMRLLKPGGSIYIGIENRIGLGYFIGYPDPHCGRPFVTVLPRKLAQVYSKLHGWPAYQNYLYTRRGYRRLLEKCGFEEFRCFLALPSYNHPRFLMPVRGTSFSYFARHFTSPAKGLRGAIRSILTALDLLKEVEYSFVMFARKVAPIQEERASNRIVRPGKHPRLNIDASEPRGLIAELRARLLESAENWDLPRDGRWNFLIHNAYTPHYSTMNVFWLCEENRHPSVVTKVFNEPCVPHREFHNLQTAHSVAPWAVPKPLGLNPQGRHWALWMQGFAGLPFTPDHLKPPVLSNFAATLADMHRAFARLPSEAVPDRYQAMVSEPLASVAAYGDCERVRTGCFGLRVRIEQGWLEALPVIPQHGDLAVNNVLVDRGKWRILDWENFGAVDLPFYDLVAFLVSILNFDGDTRSKDRSQFARLAPAVINYSHALHLHPSDLAVLLPLALANWFHLQLAQGRSQFASRLYQTITDYFERTDDWAALLRGES